MILLDTCALLWIADGERLDIAAAKAIEEQRLARQAVGVSPISAWEIGLLSARGRFRSTMSPARWWQDVLARPGLQQCPMTAEMLIASCDLPGTPPKDPADRIIAATARELGLRVVTRDRLLLAYAEAGHIQAIAC